MEKFFSFLKKQLRSFTWHTILFHPFTKNNFFNVLFNTVLAWLVFGLFIVKAPMEVIVTRMGKYNRTAKPGVHWRMLFIEHIAKVQTGPLKFHINPSTVLTKDGALVSANADITYVIHNAYQLLFSMQNSIEFLQKLAQHHFMQVINRYTLEELLTKEAKYTIQKEVYLSLLNERAHHTLEVKEITVSLPHIQLPKALFSNLTAIEAAQEKAKKLIDNATNKATQSNQQLQKESQALYQNAYIQKEKIILAAESDAKEFSNLLPHYLKDPHLTVQHLYANTIAFFFQNSSKIIIKAEALDFIPSTSIDSVMHAKNAQKAFHPPIENLSNNVKNT